MRQAPITFWDATIPGRTERVHGWGAVEFSNEDQCASRARGPKP